MTERALVIFGFGLSASADLAGVAAFLKADLVAFACFA